MKDENLVKKEEKDEEKKYINLYFFKIKIGIIITYIYMTISILMNIINRVLFHQYKFKFNFTLIFLQQFLCMITFWLLSYNSSFKIKIGDISTKDFQSLKFTYITFSLIFIMNNLAGFYGNQLIVNTPMFLTLRKLLMVMFFMTDLFIGKKKFSAFIGVCIFLVSFGSLLAGIDDFSADYIGYVVVLIYNTITVIYNKYSETFKRRTGFTNLKLLVYNSMISCPILLMLIFVSGEYKKVNNYFMDMKIVEYGSKIHFLFFLLMSCTFCVGLIVCLFLSNESNSSLFTNMLSNSKDIMITCLSYFYLKGNKFTPKVLGGLFIATIGAVLNSVKSFYDNTKRIKKTKKNE